MIYSYKDLIISIFTPSAIQNLTDLASCVVEILSVLAEEWYEQNMNNDGDREEKML